MSNPAVNSEYRKLTALEKQKQKLEKKYIILLGHLEAHPTERKLRLQQAEIKKKLTELTVEIQQCREQLDLSIKEWEDRVVGGLIEQRMIDKAVREKSRRRYRR